MKIGSIVIHCYEFDKMLEFWQQATSHASRQPATGWYFVTRTEMDPICPCSGIPKGVQGSAVDCISTSTQITGRMKWID